MKKIIDLIKYYRDYKQCNKLTRNLYFFKKNKGVNWYKGQNIGDYLSKIVVAKIAKDKGFTEQKIDNNKLLAIGSILHYANDGDIIWGSGVNGKIGIEKHKFKMLDVRMVRGPKTKKYLENFGITVPDIFGDPALLMPYIFPSLKKKTIKGKKILIPNYNEYNIVKKSIPKNINIISPFTYWKDLINEILTSEIVLTSSLHGLILSEAFGIKVILFSPCGGETLFKYEDYIEGTKRKMSKKPETFLSSINIDKGIELEKPVIDIDSMINAFPYEIYD